MRTFARTTLLFALLCSSLGVADRAQALNFGDVLNKKTLEQATQALQGSDGVPLVGNPADAEEEALGREVAGRLLATAPLVNDPALQKYVNQVGVYVAQQSSRPQLHWTFGVIASDDINAFAAPGGYIFVTSGLYRMLQNEAELAGILGHEITHVNLRHHVKLLQKTRLLAKGKDLLLAREKNATVQELAGNGAELYARSLDKEAEFACDRFGIEYAARAGYEPFAYIDALDRIGASNRSDQLALLFKTHPHPADRIDALIQSLGSRWDTLGGVTPQRWVKLAAGK